MNRQFPDAIRSQILYRSLKPQDPKKVLAELNASMAGTGLTFTLTKAGGKGEDFMLFSSGDLYVLINETKQTVSSETLSTALASRYVGLMFSQCEKMVKKHRAHVEITVGKGAPVPETELANGVRAKKLLFHEYDQALDICRCLTTQYCDIRKPLAIHWEQSHQLMEPGFFDEFREAVFPLPLYVHPTFFERAGSDDSLLIGLRTHGAAQLIGQEIVFSPANVPVGWMYERICELLGDCMSMGKVPPEGAELTTDDGDVFSVRIEEPTDVDPVGELVLVMEELARFGIERSANSGGQFDVDDPVQLAMVARLKEIADVAAKPRPAPAVEEEPARPRRSAAERIAAFGRR